MPLETVQANIDSKELSNILLRDGAAIVENALNADLLARLNADLDDIIAATKPGLRNPVNDFVAEFYGSGTIRFDGLPAKSKTFQEVMQLDFINKVADELLLPNCHHYLLNTGQLIQIGPGETDQMIHRDENAWSHYKDPKPLLEVEAMFALTDFTVESGATRVVPGSHEWPEDRLPKDEEIERAVMPAGSALFYLGRTLHGGAANTTESTWRRGMFVGFVVGWLRTEENMYLTVPFDEVKKMPLRRLVRINTLFQHSEKYRNPRESPVTPSFRCLIHELNELSIRNSAICL